ncbi:collagen alpha-1(I) chain-like [Anser cygnoides]|uniref:collagen alpha-1(I) chain-like n=1 Tax=Anser cygnoides TaxID=8845 RepID=UPI0034D1D249
MRGAGGGGSGAMGGLVRACRPQDIGAVMRLVREIAVLHKVPPGEVKTDEKVLLEAGFGDPPLFECFVAELPPGETASDGHPLAGYVLSAYTYSARGGPASTWTTSTCGPPSAGGSWAGGWWRRRRRPPGRGAAGSCGCTWGPGGPLGALGALGGRNCRGGAPGVAAAALRGALTRSLGGGGGPLCVCPPPPPKKMVNKE